MIGCYRTPYVHTPAKRKFQGRILAMWRSGSDRMVNEKSCNIRLDEIGRLNNILTNNYIIHYIREILSLSSKQKKKRKKEMLK